MFQVYILFSEKDKRTYVGYTHNITQRLVEHNSGQVTVTKNRRPLTLLYLEDCNGIKKAKEREKYWKSGAGRRKLKIYFVEGFPPIKDGRGSLN